MSSLPRFMLHLGDEAPASPNYFSSFYDGNSSDVYRGGGGGGGDSDGVDGGNPTNLIMRARHLLKLPCLSPCVCVRKVISGEMEQQRLLSFVL